MNNWDSLEYQNELIEFVNLSKHGFTIHYESMALYDGASYCLFCLDKDEWRILTSDDNLSLCDIDEVLADNDLPGNFRRAILFNLDKFI